MTKETLLGNQNDSSILSVIVFRTLVSTGAWK